MSNRLAQARAQFFTSARSAAIALGIPPYTYVQYENGTRGFTRNAERFAKFFRVDLNWLITGRGEMRGAKSTTTIPITGYVGAGNAIVALDDDSSLIDEMTFPPKGTIAALRVRGDSQFPRWEDGEWILYDTQPVSPRDLLNKFAIVQTMDGERMIKKIRPSAQPDRFNLDSLNAPTIQNVQLLAAWRYIGSLAP